MVLVGREGGVLEMERPMVNVEADGADGGPHDIADLGDALRVAAVILRAHSLARSVCFALLQDSDFSGMR